ncbi:TPR domain protein [Roseobacter sp. MED193]|uniref:tetratricopeptide repeat protein n=1 Tax=Roseobacter sp. MED193 TaxID=314262 RepID=UPI000068A365|nr:tetratricopeptide repeat protein [Roseobacter sp. MED193]EAQ44457.1 TPR domain protein [Roseobacter sp. MED193]
MPISHFRSLTALALVALSASGSLVTAQQASAEGLAGSYLAGRAATFESDFSAAADYYTRALVRDPSNPLLMENVVFAQLAQGQMKNAIPVAERLLQSGARSQAGNIVMAGGFALAEDFQAILDRDLDTRAIHPLVDGLIEAWAQMGVGSVDKAIAVFDRIGEEEALRPFAAYHKALALASAGNYGGAEELFAANDGQLTRLSRRSALARVEIQSQLGEYELALATLNGSFGSGSDPALDDMRTRLEAEEALGFSIASTARDGIAEVFFTLAAVMNGEAANDFVLMYARVASALSPQHVDAVLLSAELLDQLGRYELSIATYKQVPSDHPEYYAAEMGRAEALRRAAKPDAAAEVLEQLVGDFPTLPQVSISLGDLLRQQEDYAGAISAYDAALSNMSDDSRSRWFLHYARGISYERLKDWPKAEADFRASLALRPDSPQVLNYLGYSLIEKEDSPDKLDEALGMIEQAVAAQPNSGYIVDSLGWVFYRLGRYADAVGHMERAVELMPVDPVVNDHLGDVYWAVGRLREAEFQWKRALSFIKSGEGDGEADPDRIRSKLELGLDAVLEQEGAAPLQVANGD